MLIKCALISRTPKNYRLGDTKYHMISLVCRISSIKKQNRWVTKWPKKVRVQLAVLRFEAVNIQPGNCAKTVLPT